MTTSQPSSSESQDGAEAAFEQLHPAVQKWIWQQQWSHLRPHQAQAISPIMAATHDVIISAATASGKTEAAWLPICSVLAHDEDDGNARLGAKALYISPLKALINDQAGRLRSLTEAIDLPVYRRHGDVQGTERNRFRDNPDGILLITPESLESMFVNDGPRVSATFNGLRFIVIDELHSFIGTERGAQLQSLLHRLELATRQQSPRIGLSATIAESSIAADFLRPEKGSSVSIISPASESQSEIRMQLRGYFMNGPDTTEEDDASELDITRHLFHTLRGRDNLVFANSRSKVELFTDRLKRLSEEHNIPNEFFPHHGNLSREHRQDVEARLKSSEQPATAICTSTLEMGIDIGSADAIAQIGAPGSVAALRQRLGRSGRRGQPAVLRLYVTERDTSPNTPVPDLIRAELVESIATVELMLERWYEPPNIAGLHLSTLIQQILSTIAQHGGARAHELYSALCSNGPFHRVESAMFVQLLRDLSTNDIIIQSPDGTILPGTRGERLLNHYSFYSAFQSTEEYRLIANAKTLGSLPILFPVLPGSYLIFAGRRWQVTNVDTEAKVIDLTPATGGRPPHFSGGGPQIDTGIRNRMKRIYESEDIPTYLNRQATTLLEEGRAHFRRFNLHATPIVESGETTYLFPWQGDRVMNTLVAIFAANGLKTSQDGTALSLPNIRPSKLTEVCSRLLRGETPDAIEIAATVPIKVQEKHDNFLGPDLLNAAYAARDLDVPAAWDVIRKLVTA